MSDQTTVNVCDLTVEQVRAMSPEERASTFHNLPGHWTIGTLIENKGFSELFHLMVEDHKKDRQDKIDAAEDAYYAAFGEEIDRHPITSPRGFIP
jgi:hypothetical protein